MKMNTVNGGPGAAVLAIAEDPGPSTCSGCTGHYSVRAGLAEVAHDIRRKAAHNGWDQSRMGDLIRLSSALIAAVGPPVVGCTAAPGVSREVGP